MHFTEKSARYSKETYIDPNLHQVCEALCTVLSNEADCRPKTTEDWHRIANDFYHRWDLPLCLGK